MTAIDPRALRNAFGRFMTGVTVVTTRDTNGVPVGFTANSFSSVSLEPPLLMVCPGKFLSSFQTFATCSDFAVSILSEGQEAVSNTFASFKGDRFAQVAHRPDIYGNPLIDGAVAHFSCRTSNVIAAGDHAILLGAVKAIDQTQARGLGYANGQYFSIGLERAALDPTTGTAICGAIIQQGDRVLLENTANGYRPPQIERQGRGRLRDDLCDDLRARGVSLRLGAAYSIFDAGQLHSVYFLAKATSQDPASALDSVPLSALDALPYTTKPISDMMKRYAIEARTRSFSMYLGDALHGDIHPLDERT